MKLTFLLLFHVSILFCQDFTYYYINNETSSLAIDEKGELNIVNSVFTNDYIKYNLLIGYSPIKHLTIEGAYLKALEKVTDFDLNQKSYIISIGAYHNIEWDKKVKRNINSSIRTIKKKRGILFRFNVGFSNNKLEHSDHKDNLKYNKADFNSVYLQLGARCNFDWLRIGTATNLNFVEYKEIELLGSWFNPEEANAVSSFFIESNPIQIWSSNIQFDIGKRAINYILGFTFITNDPFKMLSVKPMREPLVAYMGLQIELDKLQGF